VWLALAARTRLTRTLPSRTSSAASVRVLAMRANHSHLSMRCEPGCAPPPGVSAALRRRSSSPALTGGNSFLAALVQGRLERAQRGEGGIGVDALRRHGRCRAAPTRRPGLAPGLAAGLATLRPFKAALALHRPGLGVARLSGLIAPRLRSGRSRL